MVPMTVTHENEIKRMNVTEFKNTVMISKMHVIR